MNEQDETLVRQSRWSGRRVVLFYWFAIIFLGTSAAAGLGTSVFKPVFNIEQTDPHAGITEPWHADDCVACHADEVAGWETTWHSQVVGEFDPNDPAKNGSKMSYNSTHYWRTGNNPSPPRYWTYNQLFNASGQQCCMTTRWTNTTLINSSTEEVLWTDDTLVDQYGGNIWDIGVSCAACHKNPGEVSLSYFSCVPCHSASNAKNSDYTKSVHYTALSDLLASSDLTTQILLESTSYWWSYVGQSTYSTMGDIDVDDFSRITCVTCHDPHDSTVNAGDDSRAGVGMSPWKNPFTQEVFGPGGSQLRTATVNELCGLCHDTSLNTTTGSYLDPTNHTTLDCTDCHGYTFTPTVYNPNGSVNTSFSFSSLKHSWKIEGGEPGEVCGFCHGNENATVYADMQDYLALYPNASTSQAAYNTKLAAAESAWQTSFTTTGVDLDKLANALALIEEAKALAASDITFHTPNAWTLALAKLDAAAVEATDALPDPTTTTVPDDTTTTTVPDDTTTTTAGTPAIGLVAILCSLGFVTLFLRKRR
jgi:hypothetical protein